MRAHSKLILVLTSITAFACGTDLRREGLGDNTQGEDSDPGVDGGLRTDGGGPATVADARVPPPDGIPPNLTPCEEAVYHSDLTFIQDKVFTPSCLTGCHSGASPKASLDLSVGRAHAALVNVVSRHDASWVRVSPGNPGASMLMVQIGGEPGPELEGFMPWGEPKLCDPLIDAIRRWVASGAPNN